MRELSGAAGVRRPLPSWLAAYGVAAVLFAVVDVIWLVVVAQPFYEAQIGHLLAAEFNLAAAGVFYLLYIAGFVHFAVRPLEARRPLRRTLLDAGLFGFFTYATWDLTSMAVFEGFPLVVAVVDIAWGATVCVAVAAATMGLLRRLGWLRAS